MKGYNSLKVARHRVPLQKKAVLVRKRALWSDAEFQIRKPKQNGKKVKPWDCAKHGCGGS